MMKQTYIQPTMHAVELQHTQIIAYSVGGNAGFQPTIEPGDGEGGSMPQVKVYNVWDDEW